MKKIYPALAVLLSLMLVFGGCDAVEGNDTSDSGNADADGTTLGESGGGTVSDAAVSGDPVLLIDVDDAFSNRDSKTEYDADEAVYINLADGKSSAESDVVTVEGDTVTVTDEGDYVISGELSDGMIIIDAEKTDKVHLILNGVKIHSASAAAMYVKTADKVFVTLEAGSENSLYTDGEYVAIDENDIDAAVFSKEDITFNGSGSLTVGSEAGHGIVSKDDVKFTGGVYSIECGGHGISSNDRAYFSDGTYNITSGKDGIHSENTEDTTLGLVLVTDGEITVNADGDGIHGGAVVQIEGGVITVEAGGGFENGEAHNDGMGGMGGFGGWWGDYDDTSSDDGDDSVSTKGIKSGGNLIVNGGELVLDAADDALHAGADIDVTNGTLTLATGDDGIHADANVTVSGGMLTITESYEGIEGVVINISGGMTKLSASDDGMNASGGASADMGGFGGMMEGSDEYGINISGGYLYMNANGDGIDSNGYLSVTGGETYIDGPTNSGNGALDYGTSATISGGIFVAVGASGMASNFGETSTQGAIMCSLSGSTGLEVTLTDVDGDAIITYAPEKTYSSALISTPDIKSDGIYIISVGDASAEIEMNGYIYGGGGGFGGGMGGVGRPGGGGRPGR